MERELRKAVRKDDADQVQRIVQEKLNLDKKRISELLIQASGQGSFQTVQYLLSLENIDVNHKEQMNEKCALQKAFASDHNAIVKLLLTDTRVDYTQVKLTSLKVAVIVNNVQEVTQGIQSVSVGREELTELLVLASWYGSLDVVQYLLEKTTVDVNSKEKETGECALYAAAKYRHQDIMELLLDQPEVDIYSGMNERKTVLMAATYGGDLPITALVMEKIRDADKKQRKKWFALARKATKRPYINVQNNSGETALMIASRRGFADIVKYLLHQDDINYNLVDKRGRTAVMVAKTEEIESLFLDQYGVIGENNNLILDEFSRVELIQAAAHGNLEKVKAKLFKGNHEDINARDADGHTALIKAAIDGHVHVVKELLNHPDINVNITDNYMDTALMLAIWGDHDETADVLLAKQGPHLRRKGQFDVTPLICALYMNNIEVANKLIDLGSQSIAVNAKTNDGKSAVIVAYNKRHLDERYMDVVERLMSDESVRNGLDFTGINRETCRELIAEIGERKPQIWEQLLHSSEHTVFTLLVLMATEIKNGEVAEKQTSFWKYVLHHREAQKYFKGAKNFKGNTLFHYCASTEGAKDGKNILWLLPQVYYMDLEKRVDRNGDTLLHVAIKNKRTDIFHQLTDRFNNYHGHPFEWWNNTLLARNKAQNTFLSIAVKSDMDDEEIIKMMEKLKYHQMHTLCQSVDRERNTLLHLATKYGRNELIRYLATKPIDEKKWNKAGHTAFHLAVKQQKLETLTVFFENLQHRDIDVNEETSETETAMHIAAKKGSRQLITQLVEMGGDLAARDEDGHTPLHDLLQLIDLEAHENDEDITEVFYEVWKTMVDVCVLWWCKRLKVPVPDEDSQRYIDMRQDAMYSLRSEITNEAGLSVLEYAATLGLTECVHVMLTQRDVFVFQIEPDKGKGKEDDNEDEKTLKTEDKNVDASEKQQSGQHHPRQNSQGLASGQYVRNESQISTIASVTQKRIEDVKPRTGNKAVRWFQNIVNRIRRENKVNHLQNDQVGYYQKDFQEEVELREKPEYKIEVSNLMPEYQCQIQVEVASRQFEALRNVLMNVLKEKEGTINTPQDTKRSDGLPMTSGTEPTRDGITEKFRWLFVKMSRQKNDKVNDRRLKQRDHSSPSTFVEFTKGGRTIGKRPQDFLQTLSKINPPVKVSDELERFPMELLAKHQWYVYQIFIIAFLVLHMAIMVWYTGESMTSLHGVNISGFSRDHMNTGSADFLIMIYAVLLVTIPLVLFLYWEIYAIRQHEVAIYKDRAKFSSYVEAEGALLNSITYVVAFLAEHITRIVMTIFISSSIFTLILSYQIDGITVEYYTWVKGVAILSGWMIVLLIARAYNPIYAFMSAMKYIIVKNMVPFFIFNLILTFAFGSAIQLQFQLLSEETVSDSECGSVAFRSFLNSVPNVVMELVIMTAGLDTDLKHIQNVGYLFKIDKYKSFVIELLIFVYGLISIILLLNLLIATMNDTYSGVILEQGKGWRQYQVKQAIRLRKLTFHKLDWLVQRIAGAEQDTDTSRWYLPISGEDLKQIRAKYWKGTDDKSAAKTKNSNDNVTFSGFKALSRKKDNDLSVETKDHDDDHYAADILEALLKEVQELRKEVNEIRQSK